jgi:4-amino-4-deoxy-L-arabinose transferase-like glycosyltransferase
MTKGDGVAAAARRKRIAIACALFCAALGLRLMYQSESIVLFPLRADAGKYFSAAFNVCHFGLYSSDRPWQTGEPPVTPTTLSAGYPLFLLPFVCTSPDVLIFVSRVVLVQAVMGALVVVFTFLIAQYALGLAWATVAASLTALSPHLIAMDGYVLTESFFTFVLTLGVLLLILAWRTQWGLVALAAGVLLSFSGLVRAIGLLLLPLLALTFLVSAEQCSFAPRRVWIKQLLFVLLGYAIISGSHLAFRNQTTPPAEETPDDFVSAESVWQSVLAGSYPGFLNPEDTGHFIAYRNDPEFERMTQDKAYAFQVMSERVMERPGAYLKWYLGGKALFMWRWDNVYNPDVYIYPMKRKGFHTNSFLQQIHRAMHVLHWPLYLLTWLAPILLFVRSRHSGLNAQSKALLVPGAVFWYFTIVLTALGPLPRYSIPARPFAFILAAASLAMLTPHIKNAVKRYTQR